MRTLSSTLLAKQKTSSYTPHIPITLTEGENEYVYNVSRILSLNHKEEPYNQRADIFLHNRDGALTELDLKGYKAVIAYGLNTSEGDESSAAAPLWVISQQLDSVQGDLLCILSAVGIPNLLADDHASASYIPTSDDTKTVKTLLTEIITATLACFNHCTAYEVVYDSEDSLIDTYQPKDSFRIYVNGSRLAAIRRLLDLTKCVMRVKADGKVHILQPTISGESYDYEYALADSHTFFSKAYRKRLVLPNYIVVQSQEDDDPQYSGYASDADSYALLPKREYHRQRLTSNDQAAAIAAAILSKYQINAEAGAAEVPMNCGAEVFDYVKVTDSRESDYRIGNIGSLTRTYKPGYFRMRFSFGGWLTTKQALANLGILDEGEIENYFTQLQVKDLYVENIMADNIDLIWLDPEGNVDLSQIGDDLDSLPDGETYARVKSLHLDAGQIKLDEYVYYDPGYNASQKRRTFTAQPTTPYDVGDLWLDANVVKRCTTARASGAYVAGDWTATTLDAILDGTAFKRVASASLTAQGLVILDQVYTTGGTYGLIKQTDISAGHILLSSVVQTSSYRTVSDGEKGTWDGKPDNMDEIGEGSTFQRVRATDISAGHIKLTSAAVFDGTWYDEGGVEIDASAGMKLTGGAGKIVVDSGVQGGWVVFKWNGADLGAIWNYSANALMIITAAGKTLGLIGHPLAIEDTVVGGEFRPDGNKTRDLGTASYYWKKLWVESIAVDDVGDIVDYSGNFMIKAAANKHLVLGAGEGKQILLSNETVLSLDTPFRPYSNNKCELGAPPYYFKKLWVNAIDIGTGGGLIMTGDIGNATYYPAKIYCDTLYYKTLDEEPWQHHDDIALLRAVKTTPKGKIDFNTFPDRLLAPEQKGLETRPLNLGGFTMLLMGALLQVDDRLKALEVKS